jgi:hypothetical protein
VQPAAQGQPTGAGPEPAEHNLVRAPGPALLLGEVVRPGAGALPHGEHVGGVDARPAVARPRVGRGVPGDRGGGVLGDRVRESADRLERGDAYRVVGADEHRRAETVAGPLDDAVKEVLLALGRPREDVVVVAVDLRTHDEGHVRVAEEAQQPLGEVRVRDVVGVDAEPEVVVVAVAVEPGVVVAVLRLRLVRAAGLVVLGSSLAAEVVHAEPGAHRLHVRVVPLVEEPHVVRAVVPHAGRRPERALGHTERLVAGNERGQEGDASAGLGRHGERIAGVERRERQRPDVQQPQPLDEADRDHHAHGGPVLPRAVVDRVVARQHQPQQEHRLEKEGQSDEAVGAQPTGLTW